MADGDPDPTDWSVDEVVNFLCKRDSAPWARSINTPFPDPATLESIIRDQFITGGVLLNDVDKDTLRDDLAVKALGHRSSILQAIEWLRQHSPKYQRSKANVSVFGDSHIPESAPSLHSSASTPVPPASQPTSSGAINVPSQPPGSDKPIRRIAPTLLPRPQVTRVPATGTTHHTGQSPSHVIPTVQERPSSSDSVLNQSVQTSPSLPSNDPKPTTPVIPSNLGPYAALLEKYPVEEEDVEDVLPQYGDSGSEGEYDDKTWQEIVDENPEYSPEKLRLSPEQCATVVSQYISKKEKDWEVERLPREQPNARILWLKVLHDKSFEIDKREHQHLLNSLHTRLQKFQRALCEVPHESESSLRKACRVMDTTISQICLQKWLLSVLGQERCPPEMEPPARAPRAPRAPKAKQDSDGEETLSSESDPSPGEYSSDFVISNSDSGERDAESDSGSVDSSHVPRRGHGLPFTLSSSPSDGSGSDAHVGKKARVGKTKVTQKKKGPLIEDIEFLDLTGDKVESDIELDEAPGSPHSPRSSISLEDMPVETPPLNPVLSSRRHRKDREEEDELTTPSIRLTRGVSHKSSSISPSPDLASKISTGTRKHRGDTGKGISRKSNKSASKDTVDYRKLFKKVSRLDWATIAERKKPLELLAKGIANLPSEELEEFPSFLSNYFDSVYQELLHDVMQAMLRNEPELKGKDYLENKLAMRTGAFFLSWINLTRLTSTGISKHEIENGMEAIENENGIAFTEFFRILKEIIPAFVIWQKSEIHAGPSATSPEASDDDLPLQAEKRPNKRKRSQHKKGVSTTTQKEAQKRQEEQAKARALREQHRMRMGLSDDDPASHAVTFEEPIIFLDPHIGRLVKPHQLTGIQFMWRELIVDQRPQGCLLAHTMGLGKTMQVISLLVTIAAAAASHDPDIRSQVPERLRRSQTLILSPSSLLQNWYEEFTFWVPEKSTLGQIKLITAKVKPNDGDRVEDIAAWNEEGGILIMSYEIFRTIIQNKESKGRGKPLSDEEHEMASKCLLHGPNIVVADEAHKIKNRDAGVTQAASGFKTMSRIAMTGSPLSNNLLDYYYMVDWIAPGYLEDLGTFKYKFVEPIEAGISIDSTRAARRRGLVALGLLNGILAPKVDRVDIANVAADLPPRTEFVIMVPLTPFQRTVYDIFVSCVRDGTAKVVDAKLWSWLTILQLCCNHPSPFREKLANRAREHANLPPVPGTDVSIKDSGLPDLMFPQLENHFATVPDTSDPNLSNRVLLLNRILDESLAVNDKILVFSQSIPTMDYLESMMGKTNRKYLRLDGSTPTQYRQSAAKNFNTKGDAHVFLISTRAGGLGLNIFGANRVVIFDFSFNPTWEQQAIGRAYRIGQVKPVFVYRFLAGGTFEELIFSKAVYKTQLAVRVVDKKNVIRGGSNVSSEYLFLAKELEREDASDMLGKDVNVLDKIINSEDSKAILKVTTVNTTADENDRLTEEERMHVENQLRLERLKRDNPQAWSAEKEQEKLRLQSINRMLAQREVQPGVPTSVQYPDSQEQCHIPQDTGESHEVYPRPVSFASKPPSRSPATPPPSSDRPQGPIMSPLLLKISGPGLPPANPPVEFDRPEQLTQRRQAPPNSGQFSTGVPLHPSWPSHLSGSHVQPARSQYPVHQPRKPLGMWMGPGQSHTPPRPSVSPWQSARSQSESPARSSQQRSLERAQHMQSPGRIEQQRGRMSGQAPCQDQGPITAPLFERRTLGPPKAKRSPYRPPTQPTTAPDTSLSDTVSKEGETSQMAPNTSLIDRMSPKRPENEALPMRDRRASSGDAPMDISDYNDH
ncbi:hypothetical protein NUU61_001844 [Penicillium alfredii]|uniref:SNF2 family helicase/ATPase n=1 Tax=Penicillium alfredii TaxID=1506179 RepID=A0A9W9FR23_9EURO|nr:uncharacterized protein NUU61_001844 [Penicillium alfredii]KAJ5104497.1 hypothetical protein NUU61_001844 [Penicillium alfredii]